MRDSSMCDNTSCTLVSAMSSVVAGVVGVPSESRVALRPDEAGATRKATLTIDEADGAAASLQAAAATMGTSMSARAIRTRGDF
jgi:hypothetical protein